MRFGADKFLRREFGNKKRFLKRGVTARNGTPEWTSLYHMNTDPYRRR
jgi:hypothetical protein